MEKAFAGVMVLPNAEVRAELESGACLRVVGDHDLATAYECGEGGRVFQVAACCNAILGYSFHPGNHVRAL